VPAARRQIELGRKNQTAWNDSSLSHVWKISKQAH
jgi:hypothetical protein